MTGVIFLNMSFVFIEVSTLKLDQDKTLHANIAKLISASTEEEKDAFGGTTDEDVSAKEVDLIFNYFTHTVNCDNLLVNPKRCDLTQGIPLLGNYETYSPPPEC